MKRQGTAELGIISAMLIFGTIGIFVKYIPMPSSMIACARGFIGAIFLRFVIMAKKGSVSYTDIKNNLLFLCLSGAAIGVNWVFLFEAYRYTTVATATLCYYLAPVFVVVAAPFLLKEPLSARRMICALVALSGMVFVSGVIGRGLPTKAETAGILYGIGAALLYAFVVILNKKINGISAYDKTMVQLAVAAIVILPYVLLTEDVTAVSLDTTAVVLLICVGIVHTGIAYTLYFRAFRRSRHRRRQF